MTPAQETKPAPAAHAMHLRGLSVVGALALIVGGGVAAYAGVLAQMHGTGIPAKFVTLFGLLGLSTAIVGLMVALGRLRGVVAMSMLCGVGTLIVSGALSEPQLVAKVLGQGGGTLMVFGETTLRDLAIVQLLCAALAGACTALHVWLRKPGSSFVLVAQAALMLGGVAGAILLVWKHDTTRDFLTGFPPFGQAIAAVIGLIFAVVFLAAGGNALIRSFEVAGDDQPAH